jgi:hypothetical protein
VNLKCVLASIVAIQAGISTAHAQGTSNDPNQSSDASEASCPLPAPVAAPVPEPGHAPPPTQPEQAHMTGLEKYGLAISAGGGVADWFHTTMRDVAGAAGTWEVRFYVGLDAPVGLELAYVGQAGSLNPNLGPVVSSTLVGNGADASLRLNIFHDLPVQPFLVAGIGWTHWTASNVNLADSGINPKDNTLAIPLGIGVAYRVPTGWYLDARLAIRPIVGDGIVQAQPVVINGTPAAAVQFVDMNSWALTGRLGYAF